MLSNLFSRYFSTLTLSITYLDRVYLSFNNSSLLTYSSLFKIDSLGVLIYSSFDGGIKIPGFVKIVATVIVFLTLIFGTFFVYIVSNGYWFYPIEEIEKIQREDVNNPINIIKYLVL